MKKVKRILLLVLMILMINTSVYADARVPNSITYEVEIKNVDGVILYNYDYSTKKLTKEATIDYKQKVEVSTIEKFNDEEYAFVKYKDNGNNITGYVLLSEFDKEKSYNIEKDKLSSQNQGYIFNEKVNLYAGPSFIFDIVETVDGNCNINYQRYSVDGQAGWIYAEINGKNGWVSIIENFIASLKASDDHRILTITNTNIYDVSKNIIGTIPKYTYLEYTYSCLSQNYYVEYNGIKGFVDNSSIFFPIYEDFLISDQDIILYNDYLSEEELITIPAKTILSRELNKVYGGSMGSLVITYNGVTGVPKINNFRSLTTEERNTLLKNDDIEDEEENKKDDEEIEVKSRSLTAQEIIILCIGGAIIFALGSAVTLIYINKSKNNDKIAPEIKPEVKNTEIVKDNNTEVNKDNKN